MVLKALSLAVKLLVTNFCESPEVDRVTFISDGAACPLEEAQVAVSQ
jgi:hypothetical protein